jgi:hypothetical protein
LRVVVDVENPNGTEEAFIPIDGSTGRSVSLAEIVSTGVDQGRKYRY